MTSDIFDFKNRIKGNFASSDSSRGETLLNSSSSSSSIHFWIQGLEVKGDKGFFEDEPLSVGIHRIFKIDIKDKTTNYEIQVILKNQDILNLIEKQKVFHVRGLIREFNINQRNLYGLKSILVRRKLLTPARWIGKARATFGMLLYLTRDCTKEDIETYLLDYVELDGLLFDKQLQRDNKKSAKSVVDHNLQVQELSREAKLSQPLSNQEIAKATLAADEIDSRMKTLQEEAVNLENHVKFCQICKVYERDQIGKGYCWDYHRIKRRERELQKDMVKEIAKYPDQITKKAEEIASIDPAHMLAMKRSNDEFSKFPSMVEDSS